MAEFVKVRGLTRSGGVRIGKKTVKNNKTFVFDMDDPISRRDIAKHSAIGSLVTFGGLDTAVATGLVASAGTTLSYSVTAGSLKLKTNAPVAVAAVTNVALTIAAATPRIDVIHVSDAGVIGKTDGVAAATPYPPSIAAGLTAIAQVRVNAGATTAAGTTYTDVAPRL